MPEIEFTCSACGQSLGAPAETAGLLVECPVCRTVITVPEHAGTVPQHGSNQGPARNHDAKSATVRIDLPPNLGLPPAAPPRRIVIRRPS